MHKVLDIALKDMTQYFRSMIALVMMFAVPILLVGMFYVMFGGNSNGEEEGFEIPVTKVIIVNQDAGEIQFDQGLAGAMPEAFSQGAAATNGLNSMGDFMVEMLSSDSFVDLMSVTIMDNVAQAKAAVDNQEAGVAILIPANFSEAFTNPEGATTVELYNDPSLTIGPNIVSGIMQQFIDSFSSSRISLQVTFEQLIKADVPIDEADSQAIVGAYFQNVFTKGQDTTTHLNVQNPAGEAVEAFSSASLISMMMTGMTVFYVFFTGASTAQSLLTEEIRGTLPRLFTTPTYQSHILGGKFLSGVLMIIVQITVLMLFGNLVFQIEWGRMLTLLPIVFAMTLAASTFGVFLMSWARTERQAGLMIGSFVTIMGMLGMLPIFVLSMPNPPQIVFTLSHLVPQGWAVAGLQIAMEGGAPADVFVNSLVLLAWSVVFFAVGLVRFRKRFA